MVLDLSVMRSLLSSLPPSLYSPASSPPSVHVAGTNGKGSVVWKVAKALQAQGLRVGTFTSPHLSSFRERVCVDFEPLSEAAACRLVPRLLSSAAAAGLQPTFFDLCTALALVAFQQASVDVCVIEVGLGGRLDSTNVIHPRLSVVTSIGLEHTQLLGSTLEAICREKCGIIKADTPVVIGPTVPLRVVEPIAAELRARVSRVEAAQSSQASFEDENRAIARRALSVLQEDAAVQRLLDSRGLRWDWGAADAAIRARPPCRYEWLRLTPAPLPSPSPLSPPPPSASVDAVLDVAHNPAAFARLMAQLTADANGRPIRAVFGMAADKDVDSCLRLLLAHCRHVHLVQATHSPRAASVAQLRQAVSRVVASAPPSSVLAEVRVDAEGDVERSVALALQLCGASAGGAELLLVVGSFALFRGARRGLGLDFATDPQDLNEASLQPPPTPDSPPSAASLSTASAPPSNRAPPAATSAYRLRVLRLYREMLHLARHLRSPLSVSPTLDVQRAFRAKAALSLSEDGAEVAAAVAEAESKAALMRAQTPRRLHRKKAQEAEEAEAAAEKGERPLYAERPLSSSVAEWKRSTASAAPLSATAAPSKDSNAAWLEGYSRIFGCTPAERTGQEADAEKAGEEGDGVRRFVFDAFGEAVVPVSSEQGSRTHQPVANSQGITDEQRRRHQQLMERFHFRGPRWKGK